MSDIESAFSSVNGCNDGLEGESIIELEEDWGDEFNDVATFLSGLHLNEYIEMFVNQGINWEIFLTLNEDDLCHIGMTNSERRAVLLKGISRWNKTKQFSDVQLAELSPEEVNAIIANTVKHLTVMHAGLAHMRLNLQKPCVHNSLMNLRLSSAKLLQVLTAEADIQAQLVINQVNALLAKKPGEESQSPSKRRTLKFTVISAFGLVCAALICARRFL